MIALPYRDANPVEPFQQRYDDAPAGAERLPKLTDRCRAVFLKIFSDDFGSPIKSASRHHHLRADFNCFTGLKREAERLLRRGVRRQIFARRRIKRFVSQCRAILRPLPEVAAATHADAPRV